MASKDPVSPELHAAVLARDGYCFMRRLDKEHICRDSFGNAHAASDRTLLTVDHVHLYGAQMGKRAPSTERNLVAMCAASNVAGPSREVRQAQREYLRGLYP